MRRISVAAFSIGIDYLSNRTVFVPSVMHSYQVHQKALSVLSATEVREKTETADHRTDESRASVNLCSK